MNPMIVSGAIARAHPVNHRLTIPVYPTLRSTHDSCLESERRQDSARSDADCRFDTSFLPFLMGERCQAPVAVKRVVCQFCNFSSTHDVFSGPGRHGQHRAGSTHLTLGSHGSLTPAPSAPIETAGSRATREAGGLPAAGRERRDSIPDFQHPEVAIRRLAGHT